MENERVEQSGSNSEIKALSTKQLSQQVRNFDFGKCFAPDVAVLPFIQAALQR